MSVDLHHYSMKKVVYVWIGGGGGGGGSWVVKIIFHDGEQIALFQCLQNKQFTYMCNIFS